MVIWRGDASRRKSPEGANFRGAVIYLRFVLIAQSVSYPTYDRLRPCQNDPLLLVSLLSVTCPGSDSLSLPAASRIDLGFVQAVTDPGPITGYRIRISRDPTIATEKESMLCDGDAYK
ncbi:hypothetical protein LSH36_690g04081 [Paralvinella palmiformis]|uniref:Uncharacterized protein n=1 Tax=Paralvinella palmiformis TaxID=53620 RepID=A0AAD9J469_9ANNE|nr:hypothetical protein LSH36_690g04081 [Paralvinella palmiformis]